MNQIPRGEFCGSCFCFDLSEGGFCRLYSVSLVISSFKSPGNALRFKDCLKERPQIVKEV